MGISIIWSIKLYKRIERELTEFSEKVSFISPELSKIDDETLFETIIRASIKNLISDNSKEINKYLVNAYFEVNLFHQIIICGYTDTDIVQIGNGYPMVNTLIKNFTMKKKAFNRQRTSIGVKHRKIASLKPNKQNTKEYVSEGNYNSKY